ncbi:AAA family ATPase [Streptomyces griseoruber]|uniref:AAA family ATPase n=1 Tax=Streptomyces griseoruber TaxID=1943 RepID=UPI0037BD51BD
MTANLNAKMDNFFGRPEGESFDIPQEPMTSWSPVDLESVLSGAYESPKATVGSRDDGVGLFYPSREHALISEPEAGKTWIALTVALTEMQGGNTVVYIDCEDTAPAIIGRLRTLGADDGLIRQRFTYVRPQGRIDGLMRDAMTPVLMPPCTLVILDGVTEAMAMNGLDPKDDQDVAQFRQMLAMFVTGMGPAFVSLDHVVKNAENRGRWATGSQHKMASLNGCAYTVESVSRFAPGMKGVARLRVAKDRHGNVRGNALPGKDGMAWFSDFVMESARDGAMVFRFEVPIPAEDRDMRPTVLMRKVSDVLMTHSEGLNVSEIRSRVTGKAETVNHALAALEDGGHITRTEGPRRAKIYKLVTPFGD